MLLSNYSLTQKCISFAFLLLVLSVPVRADSDGKAPWVGVSFKGIACKGQDTRNFGPFDYNTSKNRLPVVENAHFTPEVESLTRGITGTVMDEVDYTIVKFPNHHRALNSAIRFKLSGRRDDHLRSPMECYLQRAINFRPNDATTHMLFGMFLQRTDRNELALEEYRRAEKLAPANPNIQYNLALLLVDMEMYEEANQKAVNSYGKGFPLPGLKNKLISAGYWE